MLLTITQPRPHLKRVMLYQSPSLFQCLFLVEVVIVTQRTFKCYSVVLLMMSAGCGSSSRSLSIRSMADVAQLFIQL